MYEEDPNWQETNYRFLLILVAIVTVGVAVWSAVVSKWMLLGYWMSGLVSVFLALCLYASVVWGFGHLVLLILKLYKRVSHRNSDD